MVEIIDLTYPIHGGMFKYHSDPKPEIEIRKAIIEESYEDRSCSVGGMAIIKKYKSGYAYLKIGNHHGTHIDAPAHKIPNGETIDFYGIEKFVNKCALIDLSSSGLMKKEKRCIEREDIEGVFDSRDEKLRALIFYTGFCDELIEMKRKLVEISEKDKEKLGKEELEKKLDEAKINFEKGFSYFSETAAKYIIERNSNLNVVGIDSFSVDASESNSEVHRVFFARQILPLETLVNLKELRDKCEGNSFMLYSVPLSYKEADAAQVRAYAVVENGGRSDL